MMNGDNFSVGLDLSKLMETKGQVIHLRPDSLSPEGCKKLARVGDQQSGVWTLQRVAQTRGQDIHQGSYGAYFI